MSKVGARRPLIRELRSTRSDLPEVSMDFCFPTKGDGTGGLIILVARERYTRVTLATVVPSKSTGMFAARRVGEFQKEIGMSYWWRESDTRA